jgi:hypothetical protein
MLPKSFKESICSVEETANTTIIREPLLDHRFTLKLGTSYFRGNNSNLLISLFIKPDAFAEYGYKLTNLHLTYNKVKTYMNNINIAKPWKMLDYVLDDKNMGNIIHPLNTTKKIIIFKKDKDGLTQPLINLNVTLNDINDILTFSTPYEQYLMSCRNGLKDLTFDQWRYDNYLVLSRDLDLPNFNLGQINTLKVTEFLEKDYNLHVVILYEEPDTNP